MPWVGLQCVIVAFPGHNYLLLDPEHRSLVRRKQFEKLYDKIASIEEIVNSEYKIFKQI